MPRRRTTKQAPPKFPSMITVYYGHRRMLTLARSFLLDRTMSPYRRLSATLFLGCKGPFQLEVGDGFTLDTRAALLAPKVPRRRTVALESDIAIFDLPVGTPEFATLAPTLEHQQILALDFERFAHLIPTLARGPDGGLDCTEVDGLFQAVVEVITGKTPGPHPLDRRVTAAIEAIDQMPLDEVSLPALAKRLNLSSSRLRHLFRDELGCSLTHYARWAAVWKAARAWKQGTPFTELAHAVGFYDLAHLDHAFVETFGVNPSTVIDPSQITLIRCA